jgi:xanthine dehydrogenase accessory factor
LVLGCGESGSAIALALHAAGYAVALLDEADPAWHRRGMALTNAWYAGNAELDGEGAVFCASLKSLPPVLARRLIAATTWSWPAVADALAPRLIVDARGAKRRGSQVLRGHAPVTIGIGADFAAGVHVDRALAPAIDSTPHAVAATRHGRFMTDRRIGDAVRSGQVVGGLGLEAVRAPATGVLIGLAARGARIEPGDTIVEVDPAGVAHRCFGVAEGARRVAAELMSVLAIPDRVVP